MKFDLPKTVEINGEEYRIRYDFRVILEIIVMLNDADLSDGDKVDAILEMFYFDPAPWCKESVKACFRFIDGGKEEKEKKKRRPRLTDWEQDFDLIIGPVNRVLGYESRAIEYDVKTNTGGVHWWTWLSAFMEIGGDCLYSQIVTIRDKQARGKKLEKHEKDFARRNSDIINIKTRYSVNENSLVDDWTKGVKKNGG